MARFVLVHGGFSARMELVATDDRLQGAGHVVEAGPAGDGQRQHVCERAQLG